MPREKRRTPSMADLCQDFFILGVEFQAGTMQLPDCRSLQERVLALFQTMRQKAERAGKSPVDVDDAQYALVAYLDEMIQYSKWPDAQAWSSNPLQVILFGENVAGMNFFRRLEQVRQRSPETTEVYYFCLVLGFAGKFRLQGNQVHQELAGLVEDLRRDLGRGAKKRLSRHGEPPDTASGGRGAFPFVLLSVVAVVLSLVVGGVLYAVLAMSRSGALEALAKVARG